MIAKAAILIDVNKAANHQATAQADYGPDIWAMREITKNAIFGPYTRSICCFVCENGRKCIVKSLEGVYPLIVAIWGVYRVRFRSTRLFSRKPGDATPLFFY
jgi:hypothetical protein